MKKPSFRSFLNTHHKRLRHVFFYMAAAFCLFSTGCSNDDNTYPSVVTELVDVRTDCNGLVTDITTDSGIRLNVSSQSIRTEQKDTLLRCRCIFLPTTAGSDNAQQTAKIYAVEQIPSNLPIPLSAINSTLLSPMQTLSHWGNERYYNLRVEYKTYGQAKHRFIFTEDSISAMPDGNLMAYISARHLQEENTAQAYISTTFMSFPLFLYNKAKHVTLCFDTKKGMQYVQIR